MINEHSDTLRQAYDFDAPRRDTNLFDSWRATIVDDFLARLAPGSSILELGSGAGQGAVYVADQGFPVVAMDLSPANIELAKGRDIDARIGDFTDPGFFVGEFDALFAMNSILHVKKDLFQGVLQVMRRSLRTGGLALIVVYGGMNHECPFEDEWTDPPRFFAIYSDEDFAALETPGFTKLFSEFRHADAEGGLHPQVLVLEAV